MTVHDVRQVVHKNAYRVVQAWLGRASAEHRCQSRDVISGFVCEMPTDHDGPHCSDSARMSVREWAS